jgi:hypothetical protein
MASNIPGGLLTTAMAVMPHTDVERALGMALSLDIPFWPQLPNYSYYEDMYVQAAEHFPGIVLDIEKRILRFSIAGSIKKFLDRGGVIVWGIVPTGFETFQKEDMFSIIARLETVWQTLWGKGIDRDQMIARSMLSPATCCLVNPDKERTVERAFGAVSQMAARLRDRYIA